MFNMWETPTRTQYTLAQKRQSVLLQKHVLLRAKMLNAVVYKELLH